MLTKPLKIYVASSWRNEYQSKVIEVLRANNYEVYDFKNPSESKGFSWSEVDSEWKKWPNDISKYLNGLKHPCAERGYNSDFIALSQSDVCVYVHPCGISASLEAGYAKGSGKYLLSYIPELREPELMLKMSDLITQDLDEIIKYLWIIDNVYSGSK